jgi:hypothetical protein
MARRARLAVAAAALLIAAAASVYAQRGFRSVPRLAGPQDFDGAFHYCRVVYRSNPMGDGGGWSTDYPDADINLSIRLSELTKIRVSRAANGDPNPLIVQMTDDELFQCPFIMMQEVGNFYVTDEEAARLRTYLRKGGFLWVDDFWGEYAWSIWEQQIRKVLPASDYAIVDLPKDHAIFRAQYVLADGVPQIASINWWAGTGGNTSERGADSAEVHARGIADAAGRLMVFMTHNTDISDSWEREAEDPRYFYRFSVPGYAVGANVVLYTMTH